MSKTHPLGFRVERHLKEALIRAAKEDRRSVSSLVEIVLEKWLDEHGYLKEFPRKFIGTPPEQRAPAFLRFYD